MNDNHQSVRLDKWLWAARFFKTRNLAKSAIESGKIHIDGQRAKPSKMVSIGQVLTIRQERLEKTVIIKGLSELRKGAPEAAMLFEETQESILKRENFIAQQKLMPAFHSDEGRPNKKQRRQILQFKHGKI